MHGIWRGNGGGATATWPAVSGCFGACLNRELSPFVDVVRAGIDFSQSPRDLLRNAVLSFLDYIEANRASWIVLYMRATTSQTFATPRGSSSWLGRLLRLGTRNP